MTFTATFEQRTDNPITVSVLNNYCVLGSLAAALQAKSGLSDSEALRRATEALENNDIDTNISTDSPDGMSFNWVRFANVLRDLGFVITDSFNPATSYITNNFNCGGWAIGCIPGDAGIGIGHMYFLTDYFPRTDTYFYYDATIGFGSRIGSISGNSINDLLIK
jgi:hypothetical protein